MSIERKLGVEFIGTFFLVFTVGMASATAGVLALVDRNWLERATRPAAEISQRDRHGLESTLNLAAWMDLHHPRLAL